MFKGVDRILVVRTDKIGDVLLTTPAIAALRRQFPAARIVGMVSEVAADVYRSNPHLNDVIVLDPAEYLGFGGLIRLMGRIRREKFQIAVTFQTGFRVALALRFGGIPYRIGPLSKWWSWLVFNLGRRQIRSAVEMHEADYNIQLLRDFGISVIHTREKTHLKVDGECRTKAEDTFRKLGIQRRFRTVALHPGMAGSALNWPETHYIALGRRLLQRYNVLVTGGPGEQALVDRVVQG
ncbi:MAG: glycosyltransferase family 9 protein, partial [Bdellovibrionales bacterium]|nr:glycosyltransferase family 9 protein [Bdellovibrionales bacterium]